MATEHKTGAVRTATIQISNSTQFTRDMKHRLQSKETITMPEQDWDHRALHKSSQHVTTC